jgi:hypothetical protein
MWNEVRRAAPQGSPEAPSCGRRSLPLSFSSCFRAEGVTTPSGAVTRSLAVQATGLRADYSPWFRLSSPSGSSDLVSAGVTRAGLPHEQYEVTAESVLSEFDL